MIAPAAPPAVRSAAPLNAFSVDVEDYYHVSVFRSGVAPTEWGSFESRVERNVDRVLALCADFDVRGTFFTLGDVARRFPAVVRRIAAAGHEVASHGMSHEKLSALDRAAAREEIRASKALLEDVSGAPVRGYRAPSFSIVAGTLWALDELVDAGYAYDSSIFPIGRPDYGVADAPRDPYVATTPAGRSLVEFPLTVAPLLGRAVPVAGGGYFRLLPYAVTSWGFRRVNAAGRSGMFYLHPWEIDPGQPDLRARTSRLGAFRHYTNLGTTEAKLRRLLGGFRFGTAARVLTERGFLG
jgi:polysaccharide deacetylase family protein (PEP-CTERM system associated)